MYSVQVTLLSPHNSFTSPCLEFKIWRISTSAFILLNDSLSMHAYSIIGGIVYNGILVHGV